MSASQDRNLLFVDSFYLRSQEPKKSLADYHLPHCAFVVLGFTNCAPASKCSYLGQEFGVNRNASGEFIGLLLIIWERESTGNPSAER